MAKDSAQFTGRIRSLMREYGAQKRVADATGISYHTIKGIAGGKGTTAENWERIAAALEKKIVIADV